MRIGLLGNFGSGNLGNDGSLEAMIAFLRSTLPNAELVCICEGPSEVREVFKIPTIPIRSAANSYRFLDRIPFSRTVLNMLHAVMTSRKFDALISPGTGLLDDFSESPWGMPAILASWCAGARLSRTKVAFVSIGAGPIAHPTSRRFFKAATRMVHYRSYRDAESKQFLQSIGLDVRRDPIFPDLAFGLPSPPAPAASSAARKSITVGVGVMSYYGWRGNKVQGADIYESYLRKLVQFITGLLDRNIRVRLLVGDEVDKTALDDVLTGLALARPDYPRAAIAVPEQTNSLHDIMQQIADTDFVVATRFHNIVCALKMRKPCVAIGYAPKFEALMTEMGLGRFCQHIERLDVGVLTAQLDELMSDETMYRQGLEKVTREYEHRLSLQEGVLLESILAQKHGNGAG